MTSRWPALVFFFLGACSVWPAPQPHLAAQASSVAPAASAHGPRLAVIGDFGVGDANEAAVATLVNSWSPSAVLTVGDNNYENGEAATLDDNIGRDYHAYIQFNPAYKGRYAGQGSKQGARFFPVLGNHDWRAAGAKPYLDYFDMPGNGRYYQARFGEVEIFAVDSDPHEPDGIDLHSKQATWLQAAMAHSTATWKVVTLHHPPYSSGYHGDNAVMQWPFAEWGAHLVMGGHDHHYERYSRPGITYLVLGTGGARLRAPILKPRADAIAQVIYSNLHGALLMQVQGGELDLQFYNVNHQLIDSLRLPPDPPK